MKNKLVYIDEFGLIGSNYYWEKKEKFNLSEKELIACGISNLRVMVDLEIIEPLKKAEEQLSAEGYRLFISEGYRPTSLYEYIYKKRIEKFGKEETDRLFNMTDKPHASGKTVDVTLWSLKDNKKLMLRNPEDGANAMFIDFYKDKSDEQSLKFKKLQKLLINTMWNNGFRVGTKKEYFHFNYEPEFPVNV